MITIHEAQDRSILSDTVAPPATDDSSPAPPDGAKEVQKMHSFYQVLRQRICPYGGSLYAIQKLDYVAHEDILPYSSGEQQHCSLSSIGL